MLAGRTAPLVVLSVDDVLVDEHMGRSTVVSVTNAGVAGVALVADETTTGVRTCWMLELSLSGDVALAAAGGLLFSALLSLSSSFCKLL